MPDRITPMPNFWWCDTHGLYRGGIERPCADAVKLGPTEEAQLKLSKIVGALADWENDRHALRHVTFVREVIHILNDAT